MPLGTKVQASAPYHVVLDGVPAPRPKGAQQPPLFRSCLLWPRSPISATAKLLFIWCLLLPCCLASRPSCWSRDVLNRVASLLAAVNGRQNSNVDEHSHSDTQKVWTAILGCLYVDLKSAFDSVNTESLWLLLYRLGVPEKIVGLVQTLCTDTCIAVCGLMACALTGSRWSTSGLCYCPGSVSSSTRLDYATHT